MEAKISAFYDTNIILPPSSWDLYNEYLNQFNNGGSQLSYNDKIDVQSLENSLTDIKKSVKIITKEEEKLCITSGVAKQANGKIESILQNIENRCDNFIFVDFSQVFSCDKKEKQSKVIKLLTEYSHELNKISNQINSNVYTSFTDTENYSTIYLFLNTLKNTFFNIGKDEHKFDFGTDTEIVACSVYELLYNNNNVKITSNDRDIHHLYGTFSAIMEKMKDVLQYNKCFQRHYKNPVKSFNLKSENEKESSYPSINKGRDIIKTFSGLEEKSASKEEYLKKSTEFARFLKGTIYRLNGEKYIN